MALSILSISTEALWRYQLVSAIRARLLAGVGRGQAIEQVAAMEHAHSSLHRRCPSPRTLRRWLKAYESGGLEALEPAPRSGIEASLVIEPKLLDYLVLEKKQDQAASVPELVRRARAAGLVGPDEVVDRTTVWRALRRLEVPTTRVRRLAQTDMRRYAYPRRMMMALADGKHFRAGVERLKRVALTFLDDATRYGLGTAVSTSENAAFFLESLHAVIRRHGLMSALFLDGGPGFIADDTHAVAARLDIALIHGTKGYPEGHGKIERFNQTELAQLLRGLDGNPEVDPDPGALTLRLGHWLETTYNRTPHEGIGLLTPEQRWANDPRPLQFPDSTNWLDDRFTLTFVRTASKDNVISYGGRDYELPIGHAGRQVSLVRPVRQVDVLYLRDPGRDDPVRLHPVDLVANAYSRRSAPAKTPQDPPASPTATAASRLFGTDFPSLVDSDGNYPDRSTDPTSSEDPHE